MFYDDNAYAAMLLTMVLSPDKEEYARPLTTQEFRRFEALVRQSEYHRLGRLFQCDISALMMRVGVSEEEGYRIYTLLHRDVLLARMVEKLTLEGIEPVTGYNSEEYPERLNRKLGKAAPPFFFRCGNAALLNRPAIGIVGISGVKTTSEVREAIEILVRGAAEHHFVVVTGGELGVSRIAANLAQEYGAELVDIVGGEMRTHVHSDGIAEMIVTDRCVVVSLEHPDAMFTGSHAIARNKVLFSMTDAAFVFNTDGRRGELDILQNHYCDWVYAWESCKENRALISRGAIPLRDARSIDFENMCRHWNSSNAEQLSMFDLLDYSDLQE